MEETRSLSNIVKSYNSSVEQDDKWVIDSNNMVAERIELLQNILMRSQNEEEEFSADGFTEGLDAEMIDALLDDPDAEGAEGEGGVIKAPRPPQIDLEEIQAQADQIIADARAEADQILEDARAHGEAQKEEVLRQAREQGHEEGYAAGMQEVEAMKAELAEKEQALMADYEQSIMEIEPMLVETIGGVYEHIFHTDLSDRKDIIMYLIQNALQNTDTTADLMIHVSKEDYEYISANKEVLFDGIPGADNTEIVPDITLSAGSAMIDTGSGIFDCSIGTELAGLRKQLMLLAYHGENEG